jgi:hypothetical protein
LRLVGLLHKRVARIGVPKPCTVVQAGRFRQVEGVFSGRCKNAASPCSVYRIGDRRHQIPGCGACIRNALAIRPRFHCALVRVAGTCRVQAALNRQPTPADIADQACVFGWIKRHIRTRLLPSGREYAFDLQGPAGRGRESGTAIAEAPGSRVAQPAGRRERAHPERRRRRPGKRPGRRWRVRSRSGVVGLVIGRGAEIVLLFSFQDSHQNSA